MAKEPEMMEVPVSLVRLLLAKPEDFKVGFKYEDGQAVAMAALRVLYEANK